MRYMSNNLNIYSLDCGSHGKTNSMSHEMRDKFWQGFEPMQTRTEIRAEILIAVSFKILFY